jgi:hypothetical protein
MLGAPAQPPRPTKTLVATYAPRRDEQAVAEVEHVHQAEDERQPRRGDEDDHPHRQAGDGEREPRRRRADRRPGDEREDDDEGHRHEVEADASGSLRRRRTRRRRRGGGGVMAFVARSPSLVRSEREAEQALLQRLVVGERGHRARDGRRGRPPSPATRSPSARATWKFCSTSSTVVSVRLRSRSAAIRLRTMAGARPLLGSSIRSSRRGSTIAARDREHLLLAARELAGGMEPELLQRREQAEQPLRRAVSSWSRRRAERAASSMFSATLRSAKMPMFSGT